MKLGLSSWFSRKTTAARERPLNEVNGSTEYRWNGLTERQLSKLTEAPTRPELRPYAQEKWGTYDGRTVWGLERRGVPKALVTTAEFGISRVPPRNKRMPPTPVMIEGALVGTSIENAFPALILGCIDSEYLKQVEKKVNLRELCEVHNFTLLCPGIVRARNPQPMPPVVDTWEREIPPTLRSESGASGSRPHDAAWRQAWLSQCHHLETLGAWGPEAAQACKSLPGELDPRYVESQCRQWLDSEATLGNTQAETVLGDLFQALNEGKNVLNWSGRNLHSLPPFLDKLKKLRHVDLGNNEFTQIDVTSLAGIQSLFLDQNRLNEFDATPLVGILRLRLTRNRLTRFTATRPLTGIKEISLDDNRITHVDATPLAGVKMLSLSGNRLTRFDATPLAGIRELILSNNRITHFDASPLAGVLSNSRFTQSGASAHRVSVQVLDLDSNRLVQFDAAIDLNTQVFELDRLGLGYNGLTEFDTWPFGSTEQIDLSNNKLTEFDARPLSDMQSLCLEGNAFTYDAKVEVRRQMIGKCNRESVYI